MGARHDNGPAGPRVDRSVRHVDLIHRYRPDLARDTLPATPAEAFERLRRGNRNLARFIEACAPDGEHVPPPSPILLDAHEVGRGPDSSGFPRQEPFAVVLGCADARTPAEIMFSQSFNDIFNVRVAGNVLGVEVAGSVRYAIDRFAVDRRSSGGDAPSLRVLLALGHLNCGAVKAAVDAYQDGLPPTVLGDDSVAAILRRIHFPAVVAAAEAFDAPGAFGPLASRDRARSAELCELAVTLNAAWTARELQALIPPGLDLGGGVEVAFGIFDPRDCVVRADPQKARTPEDRAASFSPPPRDLDDLREIARRFVASLVGRARSAAT